MKKIFISIFCLCLCVFCVACESQTMVRSAHISDITGALSTKHTISVVLDQDDRVKDKYVDLQIKSSEDNEKILFGEENSDKTTLTFEKKDFWYNLNYLISKSSGVKEGEYQKYEDFGNKVFNFTAENDVKLTFRVVAGQQKKNQETGENILVLSEEISDEFELNVKKNKE